MIPLPADAAPQATAVATRADVLFGEVDAYDIDCPEVAVLAAETLQTIVSMRKTAEERRLSITRPIDDAKRAVMDLFRPGLERLQEAETTMRSKMAAWNERERRRIAAERAEAERKAREEAARLEALAATQRAAGNADAARETETIAQSLPAAAAAAVPAQTATKGVGSRTVWKFRVVDITLVPREFLILDETKVGGVVRAMKGNTSIPGIEAYDESAVTVRRA